MIVVLFDGGEFKAVEMPEDFYKKVESIVGDAIEGGAKPELVYVLNPDEYRELQRFKMTHPDYMEYVQAAQVVAGYEKKYGGKK